MRSKIFLGLVACWAVILLGLTYKNVANAYDTSGMRCGGRLIEVGDISAKVHKHCKSPISSDTVVDRDGSLHTYSVYRQGDKYYRVHLINNKVRDVSYEIVR